QARWLAAALLILGCASLIAGRGAAADTSESPIVEIERWLPAPAGGAKRVTVIIDTRLADPATVLAENYPGASAPEVTAQFTTFAKWAGQDIPVTWGYDSSNDPPGINGGPLVTSAAATWSNVSGQSFRFSGGGGPIGAGTLTCFPNPGDGMNTVLFSPDLVPGILGETCTFFDFYEVDGMDRIVEFDMHLSSTAPWSTGPFTPIDAFDLPTVILHELGHALGLDHSFDGTVMQPALDTGAQIRNPAPDDIAAIRSLYGSGPTPTPSPSPTATPTPTPTASPTTTPPTTPSLNYRARFGSIARD
ncbi:MAG: matrixin family metalloprotease, partial [Tepidiformaceae bacterium]